MDVITRLGEDHRTIHRLFEAVGNGDMAAVPQMCDALLRYSRTEEEVLYPAASRTLADEEWDHAGALEDHLIIKRLVAELADESSISPAYLTRVGILIRLVAEHVREELDILFPRFAAHADPALHGSPDARQDAGASSDGDASWVESPLTQDPRIDRSVDAVIRRTQGA